MKGNKTGRRTFNSSLRQSTYRGYEMSSKRGTKCKRENSWVEEVSAADWLISESTPINRCLVIQTI